jgi:hypothetical protein
VSGLGASDAVLCQIAMLPIRKSHSLGIFYEASDITLCQIPWDLLPSSGTQIGPRL